MANQALDIILSYAKSSALVKGVVLLGSYAVQQQTETSDLDILFLLNDELESSSLPTDKKAFKHQREFCDEFRNAIKSNVKNIYTQTDTSNTNGEIVSYECDILLDSKTVIYVGISTAYCTDSKQKILKVDCGHAYDIMTNAKYIVGSEIKPKHLPNCILIDYYNDNGKMKKFIVDDDNVNKGEIYKQLLFILSSPDPYAFTGLMDTNPLFHLHSFVEMFHNCCNDIQKDDEYRAAFHLFLLRHRLICLKLLSNGEKEHIYLPKMAYKRTCKVDIEKSDAYTALLTIFTHFQKLNVKSFENVSLDKFRNWCCFLKNCIKELHVIVKCEESFENMFKRLEIEAPQISTQRMSFPMASDSMGKGGEHFCRSGCEN